MFNDKSFKQPIFSILSRSVEGFARLPCSKTVVFEAISYLWTIPTLSMQLVVVP